MRHAAALDVTLHIGGGGNSMKGQSRDVSRSGIFVLVPSAIPQGARVDMLVDPGVRGGTLALRGQVVHVVRGTGVGIRFGELSSSAKQRLEDLVTRLRPAFDEALDDTDPTAWPPQGAAGPSSEDVKPPRRG